MDCVHVNTIEHEYTQYKLKQPCLPGQQSMTDAMDPHLEGRNTVHPEVRDTRTRLPPERVYRNMEKHLSLALKMTPIPAIRMLTCIWNQGYPCTCVHERATTSHDPSLQQIQSEDIQLDQTITQTNALPKKIKKN
jgi:hypothetical protein